MALKPYLQLVRLPNLFTAAADGLAGWLLATGSFERPERWGSVMTASAMIYAGGIVLNDLCDLEADRAERPNRPLPSGAVSVWLAQVVAAVLFPLGWLAAVWGAGRNGAIVGLVLMVCVVGYDFKLKRTPLGPWVMGACRGLNLMLGLSAAPNFGGPAGWWAAVAYAVFVAGVTYISRSETRSGESRGVVVGLGLQDLGLLGLFAAAWGVWAFPAPTPRDEFMPMAGLFVLAVVGLVVNRTGGRAAMEPTPGTIQRAVKTGIFSLVWLNVGLVAATRGPGMALAVAALWVPAFVLGKWLYAT